MSFGSPQILWLLLVLPPVLVVFFWWSWKQRQELMTQFIQTRLLPGLISGLSPARQKLRLASLVLAVAFVIVALARPQWGYDVQEVKQRGVDIVVAVDTSKSMLAEDIAPNRLARAKLAALDLMQTAKSDRLGLVAFAGTAFLQCPLTIDDVAFRQSVEALNVNLIPQGGTSIAEAIQTALTAFKEEDNHKVLVLMSDGEDLDSGAVEAAKKAAQAGLQIFTIGIGTREGELLRIKDEKGQSDYVRDEQGNVVKSHLDEDRLREIAGASEHGFYLPLRGAKTIDTLYEQGLANLPKSEHQEKRIHQPKERFRWPLTAAILLLLLEMLLPERKTERSASQEQSLASRARTGAAVGLLLLLVSATASLGSPSSALREYKAGKYDEAFKEYEQSLRRKGDDPRLHFNAGTSAYRNQQFEQATKEFEKALTSPDLKLQQASYYNRGNAWYWLGEKNADPQKRSEAWKKAVEDYDLSLKLNPQDGDARFNHEFVQKKLEELKRQQQQQSKNDQPPKEPSEAAKKAKAEADEAVRRREYAKALAIMEKQLQQDETTAYYGDYIQRLKEINGVQEHAKQ
jgi:Ca-activated chloride channel family protein